MKGLTTLGQLGVPEIRRLIDLTLSYKQDIETGNGVERLLQHRVVANAFFEPSTRTLLSFELAAKRLSGHVITFHPEISSSLKGESLQDTMRTITAIGADILVVRHAENGFPDLVQEWTAVPVINGGDGSNEHPTQGLLDAATLTARFSDLTGLKMGVVGDVGHSRVAGSLVQVMPTLGVDVTFIGPESLLPESPIGGVEVTCDLDAILPELDVIYLLRVQRERGALVGDDYETRYRLDGKRASRMKPEAVIMHPGPLNRGVEIAPDVADGPRSLILDQVRHGVPTRMAVLAEISRTLQ
ncbi:MAG: aspartate carbamoyltransferase catalytic subunit [Acidimicrobiia bacterium]